MTVAVAVLVQPVAELETVTVYVPVALTLGFAVVPPETMPGPAQLKPVPVVVDAERTTDVVVHVKVPPVALAPGPGCNGNAIGPAKSCRLLVNDCDALDFTITVAA